MISPRKAQIAVIITLVIAVIFLFVLVFLNIAKLSSVKILTAKVADGAALNIASKIGSMSNYLKVNILKGKKEQCQTDWLAIALIALGIILLFFCPPVGVTLFAIKIGLVLTLAIGCTALGIWQGITTSQPVRKAIYERFQGMSTYNAAREATLYEALEGLQTDDELLKPWPSGSGWFYWDENKDNAYDPGELRYDLSDIEKMRSQRAAGRFFAWYYTRRIPRVSNDELKDDIDDFIDALDDHIVTEQWDATKWRINKASLIVGPVNIPCASSATWVAAPNRVRVVTIDADYQPSGFLDEKFKSLCKRLNSECGLCPYNLSFYGKGICPWCNEAANIDQVIGDLVILVGRLKDLKDLPLTQRVQALDGWLQMFYDINYTHDPNKGGEHDVYDRLSRALHDNHGILQWIDELTKLNNNTIIPDIKPDYGTQCEQGRGAVVAKCYTDLDVCYCWHHEESCAIVCDGDKCIDLRDARWRGPYGTCTGKWDHSNHPVCKNGDLYGCIPPWCSNLRGHVPCITHSDSCDSCSPPPTVTHTDRSFKYQGQLAWNNTSGYTEVRQAIDILNALKNSILEIRQDIKNFADYIRNNMLPNDHPIRNEIVYAWKDRMTDHNHVVAVKMLDYPETLPHIEEYPKKWWPFTKCRGIRGGSNNDGTGDLRIITWRYDQDRPLPWWSARYRKKPDQPDFDQAKLVTIVADMQDDALIGPANAADLVDLLSNYAVTSSTKAHYGPDKPDIRIVETEGD
jgi:hypothetical protein